MSYLLANTTVTFSTGEWVAFTLLILWSLFWKGIALWRAGRNNQLGWFIFMLILNTAGLLEILYLAFFQRKRPE